MNKFINTIAGTSEGIRRKRAENVGLAAQLAQESLINDKRKIVQNLDAALNRHLDIGPDSADSLRPVDQNFDAAAWVNEVHQLKYQLKRASEQLEIAVSTYNEWFATTPAQVGAQVR